MYLFFDTETTGLPRNHKAPASDVSNWPRLVQIAWLVTDEIGNEVMSAEHIIIPQGFFIPDDVTRIHGISTEHALNHGIPLSRALTAIESDIHKANLLIAHNMAFDEKILGAEFIRSGRNNPIPMKSRLCTMKSSTKYCHLPGPYGMKWPTLEELHFILFGSSLQGAHRALKDVRACAKCYFELKRRGILYSDRPAIRGNEPQSKRRNPGQPLYPASIPQRANSPVTKQVSQIHAKMPQIISPSFPTPQKSSQGSYDQSPQIPPTQQQNVKPPQLFSKTFQICSAAFVSLFLAFFPVGVIADLFNLNRALAAIIYGVIAIYIFFYIKNK